MSPIRKKTSSLPTLQIVVAIAMALVVIIVVAYMLAPRRPQAPPRNVTTIADRPTEKVNRPANNFPGDAMDAVDVQGAVEPLIEVVETEPAPAGLALKIVGEVRDKHDNKPLAEARLVVRLKPEAGMPETDGRAPARKSLGRAIRSGESDAEGKFELLLDKPGEYILEAQAKEYMIATVEVGLLNEQRPVAEMNIALSLGARVAGRVTEDGSSLPISDVVVTTSDKRHRASTDANGEYEIVGLSPGSYDISLDLSNTLFKAGKTLPFQKVEITGPDQALRGIDFQVAPAGLVWGYVVTPDNKPVTSAEVLLCTSDSVFSQAIKTMVKQAPPLSDRSESDGYYELVGVPLNEEWRVYATNKAYSPQLADPFLLTASNRSVRVDIYMFGGTVVSGRVVDNKRAPVPGAEVMCMPSYSNLVSPMESAQAFKGDTADDGGNFVIEQLPPGDYQVFARKKGYKIAIVGEPIYPDGYNSISGLEIVLDPVDSGDHAVFGKVSDTAGALISGANVELSGVGSSMTGIERQATTDGSGEFRFDGVEAGGYSLTVTKEGYAPRKAGRVALDKPTNVIMDAAAVVRGHVLVKETRTAPPSYTVAALPLNQNSSSGAGGGLNIMRYMSERVKQSFANPDGSFELYVPAGDYRLQASAADHAPGVEDVTLTPGQVLEDVELLVSSEGGVIAGRVVTSDGNSPQGATVFLVPATTAAEALVLMAAGEEAGVKTSQVGSDGAFVFEQLSEGTYVVIVQHSNYATGQSDVIELPEGGKLDNIEVRLGSGGVLEGYVYRNGRIAANTMVMVLGNGSTSSDSTDHNGYYYIEGLATGTYQAMVVSAGGGLIPNPMDTEGIPVDVVEGQTTRYDFGAGEGTKIIGLCSPPPPPGLLSGGVVLRQPGINTVPLGESVSIDSLTNGHFRGLDGSGSFELNNVPPGEWQLDIYYVEPGNLFEVRYVHTELVVVTGEQPEMNVDLFVQAY